MASNYSKNHKKNVAASSIVHTGYLLLAFIALSYKYSIKY